MPNIHTYDADKLDIRPTEIGVDARAAAARRIGSNYDALSGAYREVGRETESLGAFKGALQRQEASNIGSAVEVAGKQAEKWADHQQISAGAPAFAKLMQAKEQQWNEKVKNADPNDPTVGKKYLDESLEPDLQKFVQDGFYTDKARNWAEAQVNAFRSHMYSKTSADMSAAAGQAAVLNQHQTINSLSTTVRSDPSSLDFSLATLDHATDGVLASSPNLSAADALKARGAILQKGKEEIIKSAAVGYIEKTGNVPDWASDPKYSKYINGAELKTMEAYAKTQQRFAQSEARAARLEAKQNAQADFNRRFVSRIDDMIAPDGTVRTPTPDWFRQVKEDIKSPGAEFEPGRAEALVNWGIARVKAGEQERKIVTDQATFEGLTKRLFDETNPLTLRDVIQAQAEGKLGDREFTHLKENLHLLEEKPLKTQQFKEATKAVEQELTYQLPGMPGKDPKGQAAYSAFVNSFIPQYVALDRAGKLPPNALDVKDPNSLISQAMAPYKRTTTQKIQDFSDAAGVILPGGATPRPAGAPPVPAPLRGIGALGWSPKTNRFYDQASGQAYMPDGTPVK